MIDVNYQAAEAGAAQRTGRSPSVTVPGLFDGLAMKRLSRYEHVPIRRKFWSITGLFQCQYGLAQDTPIDVLTIAVDGSSGPHLARNLHHTSGSPVPLWTSTFQLALYQQLRRAPRHQACSYSNPAASWSGSTQQCLDSVRQHMCGQSGRRLWSPKVHAAFMVEVQRLLETVTNCGITVSWCHVRSQLGNFVNEGADVSAKLGSTGASSYRMSGEPVASIRGS